MARSLSLLLLATFLLFSPLSAYYYPSLNYFNYGLPYSFGNPTSSSTTTTTTTDDDDDETTTTTTTNNYPTCNSYQRMFLIPGVCGCCPDDGFCLNAKRMELKLKLDSVCTSVRGSLQEQRTALDALYYGQVLACEYYIRSQLDRWYLLSYRIVGCGTAAPAYTAPAPVQYAAPTVQYAAPTVQYAAPTVQYAAPTVQYAAPTVQYAAPTVQYASPTTGYQYTNPSVNYASNATRYVRSGYPSVHYH